MKHILSLIIIITIICTNLTIITFANNSYLSQYIKENEKEFNDIVNYLKNYGGTALPSDPDEIKIEDIIRIHTFKESHLPNILQNTGNLSENIINTNEYKYFSPEGYTLIVGKNDDNKWEVLKISNELKTASQNHKEISFKFKDMIENIEELYPNYDFDSVKYIEYKELGSFLVYFISENTEYLACYPINNADNGEKVTCGKIYTVEEYIDIIDDYPIFNNTTSDKGIGGGIETTTTKDITHWYVYPLMGVIVIGFGVAIFIIKRKKSKI
ncbi:MAG: hypothetical protein IKT46_04510 [Clostridia bacterium]|nr:hypothetical protein [Clostridia bacterium]